MKLAVTVSKLFIQSQKNLKNDEKTTKKKSSSLMWSEAEQEPKTWLLRLWGFLSADCTTKQLECDQQVEKMFLGTWKKQVEQQENSTTQNSAAGTQQHVADNHWDQLQVCEGGDRITH